MNSKKIPQLDLHGKGEEEVFDLLDQRAGFTDCWKRTGNCEEESYRISGADSLLLEL